MNVGENNRQHKGFSVFGRRVNAKTYRVLNVASANTVYLLDICIGLGVE